MNTIDLLLHSINIFTHLLACAAGCDYIDHYDDITRYYNSFVDSLSRASRVSVTRIPQNASNHSDQMNLTGSKRLVLICIVYGVNVASHDLTLRLVLLQCGATSLPPLMDFLVNILKLQILADFKLL